MPVGVIVCMCVCFCAIVRACGCDCVYVRMFMCACLFTAFYIFILKVVIFSAEPTQIASLKTREIIAVACTSDFDTLATFFLDRVVRELSLALYSLEIIMVACSSDFGE